MSAYFNFLILYVSIVDSYMYMWNDSGYWSIFSSNHSLHYKKCVDLLGRNISMI